MLDLDSMLCPFCGGEIDERGGQCNYNKKTIWFAVSKFCPNCGKTMIKAEDDK